MKKRVCTLLVVVALAPTFQIARAQETARIRGTIVDRETKKPIPGASILVQGTAIGTASDTLGNFSLLVPLRDSSSLTVRHIGYKETSRELSLDKPKELILEIEMEPLPIPMADVEVSSGRRKDERFPEYTFRAADLQRSGESDITRALHYLQPWLFPKTELAWQRIRDNFTFYVDSTHCEVDFLNDLDLKQVKRVRVWDNRWGITPMGFPSLMRSRYVVSIETK